MASDRRMASAEPLANPAQHTTLIGIGTSVLATSEPVYYAREPLARYQTVKRLAHTFGSFQGSCRLAA